MRWIGRLTALGLAALVALVVGVGVAINYALPSLKLWWSGAWSPFAGWSSTAAILEDKGLTPGPQAPGTATWGNRRIDGANNPEVARGAAEVADLYTAGVAVVNRALENINGGRKP